MPIKFDQHEVQVEADHAAEVQKAIAEIVSALPVDAESDIGDAQVQHDPALARADVAPAPVADSPAPAPAAAPAASEVPAPASDDRGMLRLLEREGQVRDREAQLEQRERAFSARLTEVEQNIADRGRIAQMIQDDPEAAFKALGVDPEAVNTRIVARVLGDKAPPEMRRAVELDPLKREIAQLRAERERERLEAQWAAERKRVQDSASQFSSNSEGTSKYPALATVAKADSAFVAQEIYNEIARDAAERSAREPNVQPIPPETAAERLNKRWEVFSKAFQPTAPQAAAPAPQSTNVSPPAQNAPAATQPKPASPPPRRPYWEKDRDVERDAAIQEAVKIAKGLIPAPTA